MRNHFRCLLLSEAVVHRPVEMVRNLRSLAVGNQGAHRDQTSIAGSKVRAKPQIPEQDIRRVLHDSRSHVPELLLNACRPFLLGCLIERKQSEAKRQEADRLRSCARQRLA